MANVTSNYKTCWNLIAILLIAYSKTLLLASTIRYTYKIFSATNLYISIRCVFLMLYLLKFSCLYFQFQPEKKLVQLIIAIGEKYFIIDKIPFVRHTFIVTNLHHIVLSLMYQSLKQACTARASSWPLFLSYCANASSLLCIDRAYNISACSPRIILLQLHFFSKLINQSSYYLPLVVLISLSSLYIIVK